MELEAISHEIFFSRVQQEPELSDDLDKLLEFIRDKKASLVIDLSQVDIITSTSLTRFDKLWKHCSENSHHLVLCNASPVTRGIFTITQLDLNEFESDKANAIELVKLYMEDSNK